MRKMRKLITGLLALLLATLANIAGAENRPVSDRDLFQAIQDGQLERFTGFLAGDANWNAVDGRGNSLIHALIYPASISLPQAALASGTGQQNRQIGEVPPIRSVRPVKTAVRPHPPGTIGSRLQMIMGAIRRLVERGVPINGTNQQGQTPLHLAVQRQVRLALLPWNPVKIQGGWEREPAPDQSRRFCEFLLELGADPRRHDAGGRTPLFYADAEMYPLLLRHGADLESRDQNGMTPFLAADSQGALALLRLGADAHTTDSRQRNRWHYLYLDGWKELAQKLLELHVDINQRDLDGRTPLLHCCRPEKFAQMVFLVEHGAGFSLADRSGQTALHAATIADNPQGMEWLLRRGAAVNCRNNFGKTPIHYATFNKKRAQLLLRYKANPNIPDNDGNNVLHGLAQDSQTHALENLSLFIRHGAFVNQKNKLGETPLVWAYKRNNTRAMKLLLENGADPNLSTFGDLSLLDRAELDNRSAMGFRSETISLLREHGAKRRRSWFDRHPHALLIGYAFLGIIPFLTFLFSLYKPSGFTKKVLAFLLGPLAFFLLCRLAAGTEGISFGESLLPLILAMPPLAALLMSLSGTRALADRCPPRLGIPLSFLNAAGCMGLTFGVVLSYFSPVRGEGGILLAYDALFGGGAAAGITLIFAVVAWKKRLAPAKIIGSASGSSEVQDKQSK